MPDSSSTIKPSGSQEKATPIKQSAAHEKDISAIQESNEDTHMSEDEEDESNGTDHNDADVEEVEDGKEEEESEEEDDDDDDTDDDEEEEEKSDKETEDEGTKTGTILRQSPVRSHLPVKAHHSSPIKAFHTSPVNTPRSSTPARTQSPFKAPLTTVKSSQPPAKVSDEAAVEANRPKSSMSNVRRQAQTPELKPKRSQKAPSQSSPSKPSRLLPSKTTQPSPSKAGDIAEFDWDAFEKRYDQALDEANHKESELLKEFDQLVQVCVVQRSGSVSY